MDPNSKAQIALPKLEPNVPICISTFQPDTVKGPKHKIQMILITPIWVAQPWYPQLLGMVIHNPIIPPQTEEVLSNLLGTIHPLLQNGTLKLAAWLILGDECKIQACQNQLPDLSLTDNWYKTQLQRNLGKVL